MKTRVIVLTLMFVAVFVASSAAAPWGASAQDAELVAAFDEGAKLVAAKKGGCAAIPHEGLNSSNRAHQPYRRGHSNCVTRQREKNRECRNYRCNVGKARKHASEINDIRDDMAAYLKAGKPTSSRFFIDQMEKQERLQRDLATLGRDAVGRRQQGDDCLTARDRVQDVFETVVRQIRADVRGSTNRDFLRDANVLIRHFTDGAIEHEQPFQDVRNAMDSCDETIEINDRING